MNGIGARLREERERLGLTQRVFGDIGGVEPNAQGKYESGERTPKADYLAAVATRGVDALYVLSGTRTPVIQGSLSPEEERLLGLFAACPQPIRPPSRNCSVVLPMLCQGPMRRFPGVIRVFLAVKRATAK